MGQVHVAQNEASIRGFISTVPSCLALLTTESFDTKLTAAYFLALQNQIQNKFSVCETHFTEHDIPLRKAHEACGTIDEQTQLKTC